MSTDTGPSLTVKREPYTVVQDSVLEDKRMRPETRLVLAWLLGRPNNWIVYVGHVQRTLGLSPNRWARARKEMQKAGYLVQRRERLSNGRYKWVHEVFDRPRGTIPSKATDGETIDGETIVGRRPDIRKPLEHQNPKQQNLNSLRVSIDCIENARALYPGYDIESMERDWIAWASRQDESPRSPEHAFLGWLRKQVDLNPLSQETKARLGFERASVENQPNKCGSLK